MKDHYDKLRIKYNNSQEEINRLKELIPESKENGLFGRFFKPKHSNDNATDDDVQKELNNISILSNGSTVIKFIWMI